MAKDGTNRGGSRPGSGRKKKTPEGTYEHALFTAEQLKELTDSPHVAYVSSKTVSYTKAFKTAAWQRYCDGIDPVQIFSDAGLNVDTLGKTRILGFFKLLREAKAKGVPFTEGNDPYPSDAEQTYSFPTPPRRANRGRPPVMSDSEINKLATKVAYMSQELEFLKKIILAEKKEK
jgi:hypothetical protein